MNYPPGRPTALEPVEHAELKTLIIDGMKPAGEWTGPEVLYWIRRNTQAIVTIRTAQRILKGIRT